jgi:hypothetical protein
MKRKSRHPLLNDRNLVEDHLVPALDDRRKQMEAAKERINQDSKTLSSQLDKAWTELSSIARTTVANRPAETKPRKIRQGRKRTRARERMYEQNRTLDKIIQQGKGPASVWAPNGGNPGYRR